MAESSNLKIGFIGAGNMAQALAEGFINKGIAVAGNVTASCPPSDQHLLTQFKKLGCRTTHDNTELIRISNVVILAIKPQVLPYIRNDLQAVTPHHTVISVLMGTTLAQLEQEMPAGSRVVRIMPNTPSCVGEGASSFSLGSHTNNFDAEVTTRLLSAVGACYDVPESSLNAITGISGSGPAYIFMAIEAMADGGVKMGLPRTLAVKLAAQTVLGSAKMVLSSEKHPGHLKDDVCSPAGCTIDGVEFLEERGFRSALMGAVRAAALRTQAISDGHASTNLI